MKVKRGDIVYLNRTFGMHDHLQGGNRPYVVVSNDVGNFHSQICLICPLTKVKRKNPLPTHAHISYNDSTVLCEQIFTIPQSNIFEIKYHLSDKDMNEVDIRLLTSLYGCVK